MPLIEDNAPCVYKWGDSIFDVWVDTYEPAWGICYPGKLNEIYTDSVYVYAAYSKGLDIIDLFSEQKIAYIEYDYGFTSVCGDDYNVYLGTLNNSVMYVDKTTVSGSYTSPICLNNELNKMNLRFPIQSNRIKHLFISNNNLSIVTLEGIDIINFSGQGYRSFTTSSGVMKSFITPNNELYYISCNNLWQVNKVNSVMFDWIAPNKTFIADGSLLPECKINDLFITNGEIGNTLFIATSSGVYVIDELTNDYNKYYDNVTSVWADLKATFNSGNFYLTTTSGFYIIDMVTGTVVDWATFYKPGSANELVEQTDIVDLNVKG